MYSPLFTRSVCLLKPTLAPRPRTQGMNPPAAPGLVRLMQIRGTPDRGLPTRVLKGETASDVPKTWKKCLNDFIEQFPKFQNMQVIPHFNFYGNFEYHQQVAVVKVCSRQIPKPFRQIFSEENDIRSNDAGDTVATFRNAVVPF